MQKRASETFHAKAHVFAKPAAARCGRIFCVAKAETLVTGGNSAAFSGSSVALVIVRRCGRHVSLGVARGCTCEPQNEKTIGWVTDANSAGLAPGRRPCNAPRT